MYYGQSKEEIKLMNLLKRLGKGEILTKQEFGFVEEKLQDEDRRKVWQGCNFLKSGLDRAFKRMKDGS